jgi:hypothetical protein
MSPVTNRVPLASVGDLLAAPPRATLAWIHEGALAIAPVRIAASGERVFVAVDIAARGPAPLAGEPASLVLDDGWSWFALRAVILRGTLVACTAASAPGPGTWLELRPERTTAWDYGALREEPGP